MSNTFIAIDFETANSVRASACQVGLAKFADGDVVEKINLLVKPHSSMRDFDFFNTQIHGISAADVQNSPEFAEYWPQIRAFIGDAPLVAHNAGFDMSVLRGLLDIYQLDYPELDYVCTFMLARNLLKPAELNLAYVARELGVALENHHDALADAIAAGEIAQAMIEKFSASSILELAQMASIRAGRFTNSGWRGSVTRSVGAGGADESIEDMRLRLADQIVVDGPLAGLTFVITGAIPGLTRSQAHELILLAGGEWGKSVTRKTDFLVDGDGVGETNKTRRVYELREKGHTIAIVDPEGFLGMLVP